MIKKANERINKCIEKIDNAPLGFLAFFILGIIMAPILHLGKGAVFPVVDQLDEVILNSVFTAQYWGEDTIDRIMCGIPAAGMKPSSYFFIPLYIFFEPFTAFVVQHFFVIATAFFGVYLVVRKVTHSSISAIISATVFALLPFRSIYGTCLAGFPLTIYCYLLLKEYDISSKKIKHFFLPIIGLLYCTFSSNLVLNGFAVIAVIGCTCVWLWVRNRRMPVGCLTGLGVQVLAYLLMNIDLIIELFGGASFVSHRVEFVASESGRSFFDYFFSVLTEGISHNESFHTYIILAVIGAIPFLLFSKKVRDNLLVPYLLNIVCIILIAGAYAFFSTDAFIRLMDRVGGMLGSFQFDRFFYLLPGLWYILLGISIAVITRGIKDNLRILGWILALLLYLPTLLFVAKNKDSIFYMNVNQINNKDITGYITWEGLYSEDVMAQIEADIGEDMGSYRVASIGICPVVSLMHGFYTIDGYSNNYSLEYKHTFGEIQTEELELNDYSKAYFNGWGSRCYLFYHEWGNGFLLGKNYNLKINDFRFNLEKMKKLNCKYILCAGEIENPEAIGLGFMGQYTSDSSYWNIWVYEIK